MKYDAEIQEDVLDELRWLPILQGNNIDVIVDNGIATLSGTVDAYMKKTAAVKSVKRLSGVKGVNDFITVHVPPENRHSDEEIAMVAWNALKWHSALKPEKISIEVEDGWVTLEGEVEWDFERTTAFRIMETLQGVTGITNNIRLKPSTSPADIRSKITLAFHRRATVDLGRIDINIQGSKVVITGKVRSYAEMKDAESTAWLAPGVTSVENRLEVDTAIFSF
jgi:osmotically-inducible protein OsmY